MIQRGGRYCIHIEFGIPMNLAELITMCLSETHSKVY
jgi:hypothetical protein